MEKVNKEVKVKGNDPVTIVWLEGVMFHKVGSKSVVHRLQAEKLVKAKKAKLEGTKTETA